MSRVTGPNTYRDGALPMKYNAPGVYIEEIPSGIRALAGIDTSTLALVDVFVKGPVDEPRLIRSFNEFEQVYGGLDPEVPGTFALHQFFLNGGSNAWVVRNGAPSVQAWTSALDALVGDVPDPFQLMALPGVHALGKDADIEEVYLLALSICSDQRAFLLIDPPEGLTPEALTAWGPLPKLRNADAALFYPWVQVDDPSHPPKSLSIPASGTIAGIFARTDQARGVWKAPAGLQAGLVLSTPVLQVDDKANAKLNAQGLNALRTFQPAGPVVWGSRTLVGGNTAASDWRYIPVRRLALYLESSLLRGLGWVVFEPNDEPLWSQVRLSVGNFIQGLFRQGAFQGAKSSDAYFVRCDSTTTSAADQAAGILNVLVGFAPLKPAEFIVIALQLQTEAPAP